MKQHGTIGRVTCTIMLLTLSLGSFAQKKETVLELESYIVGDKEQPAVSYFVPWQGTKAPDKLHWNIEDKNDKTLELVDRDIMLRSIDIYNELNLETAQPAAGQQP